MWSLIYAEIKLSHVSKRCLCWPSKYLIIATVKVYTAMMKNKAENYVEDIQLYSIISNSYLRFLSTDFRGCVGCFIFLNSKIRNLWSIFTWWLRISCFVLLWMSGQISGIYDPIDMDTTGIWIDTVWIHYMALTFDPTHDPDLVFSR